MLSKQAFIRFNALLIRQNAGHSGLHWSIFQRHGTLFFRDLFFRWIKRVANRERYIVGYFCPNGITKYDGPSTPQIDGKTSKKILYSSLQRYNAMISQASWLHRLRRSWLYNYSTTLLLLLSLCSHTSSLFRPYCRRPLYTQKWCYISELSATYYHIIWTNHVQMIRAATDNPFLLSYTWPSCIDIRPEYLWIITILHSNSHASSSSSGLSIFLAHSFTPSAPLDVHVIIYFPNYVLIITQDFNDFVGTEVLISCFNKSQLQSWLRALNRH